MTHVYCVFCGKETTQSSNESTVCDSPINTFPADTVGNKHHAYLMSAKERARLAVQRLQKIFSGDVV